MDDKTLDLLSPFNQSEYENDLRAVESAEREADSENELEHAEAGLPFYKLSKSL